VSVGWDIMSKELTFDWLSLRGAIGFMLSASVKLLSEKRSIETENLLLLCKKKAKETETLHVSRLLVE
jgi:hypothetical protein